MRILFVGDVVGRPGRRAFAALLPALIDEHEIDFAIANGENAAGGIGITERTASEVFEAGVDVMTGGNHIWDKREALPLIEREPRLLRPANYPPGTPGRGHGLYETRTGVRLGVVNLQGRVFMQEIDCPFRVGTEIAEMLRRETPVVLIDMHAEATAEKMALGWHLAGIATAVLGTHTHIQTADERILREHTAYVTDVGMVGPRESVIGVSIEPSVTRFTTQLPQRFEVAGGETELDAVVLDVDEHSGATRAIRRIQKIC